MGIVIGSRANAILWKKFFIQGALKVTNCLWYLKFCGQSSNVHKTQTTPLLKKGEKNIFGSGWWRTIFSQQVSCEAPSTFHYLNKLIYPEVIELIYPKVWYPYGNTLQYHHNLLSGFVFSQVTVLCQQKLSICLLIIECWL